MIKSSEWIKENMLGHYSQELGRQLTEAELRVQRCLKQLSVPDWYIKHSKPHKLLKNHTPIECRPPVWKTIRAKGAKSPRRRSPKNSPRKSPSKDAFSTGTLDSGYGTVQRSAKKPTSLWNEPSSSGAESSAEELPPVATNEAYRIARKTPRKSPPCISISPSSSECETSVSVERSPRKKQQQQQQQQVAAQLNRSSTFPKMTPSRKIANLNIVLAKPPPLVANDAELPGADEPILASSMSSFRKPTCLSSAASSRRKPQTPKSKVYCTSVEIKPKCNVRPESPSSSDEDEDEEELVIASPTTHFFNSEKKSVALERVVQSKLSDSGCSRGLIQDIISELGKSVGRHGNSSGASCGADSHRSSFVKSMASALEQSFLNDDCSASSGSDSDLAKSTSISFKSYDSADERPNTPPLHFSTQHHVHHQEQDEQQEDEEEEEEDEDDVYWIPSRMNQLPRTSSLLSLLSKGSSARDRCSPRFSPIDDESDERRSNAYKIADLRSTRLFRIDETGVLDSGYSDRSTSPSNSATTTTTTTTTPYSSSSSSSPLVDSCHPVLSYSGPYVLQSFFV